MKNKIMTKGLAGLLAVTAVSMAFTSCKDDYLDLAPITSYPDTVIDELGGLEAATVGLCNAMYRGADYLGFNGANGEPWLLEFYGEALGNANLTGLWGSYVNFGTLFVNGSYVTNSSAGYSEFMWVYCYNLIDDANQIIAGTKKYEPKSEDEAAQVAYYQAIAYTMRAHAYIRLLQTYAPRWADSNNGSAYAVILRTEPTTPDNTDVDFSTMNQVLGQIYEDLDEAIALFEEGYSDLSNEIWAPSVDVAKGLYARAAMLQNDYPMAMEKALEAMANYDLMSANEYRSGFVNANSEYMWATAMDAKDLFWDTFGGWTAFNGYYTAAFGIGDSMDYTLYKNLSMTDCRKYLYLMPELCEIAPYTAAYFGITPNDFFTTTDGGGCVDDIDTSVIIEGPDYIMDWFCYYYGAGKLAEYGYESALVDYSGVADVWGLPTCKFGFGMKFWGTGDYCSSNFPFMRASEMGYIVAEAAYMMGDETTAQQMMNYLNQDVRDPYYDCTLTGDDLLDHIKAYREIELWDEGFNWFDLKRWGDPAIRVAWEQGNPDSGNWGPLAKSFAVDDFNGWRWAVPESEYIYNKGADRSKVM
ncbi:MAG: RagB/SusD family nutrient uptake outer membrane protein [Muribaculaceae bacterium]|nr:RagB/SusD family nutrient uptake outer membrane protein [Muribaculaceae bacterium]